MFIDNDNEKRWIRALKKEHPELDIKRDANGEYFLLMLPKCAVKVVDVLSLVEVNSEFADYHTHNVELPILLKKENCYAITFCYFTENDWIEPIRKGRVYLFKKP